jgi:hypothetical protein
VSLFRFCAWLAGTPWSIALHESHYVFLIVLTVHVLTLTVFLGTVVMVDLRFLGVTLQRMPVSEVVTGFLPLNRVGLLLMLASGALLFYAAPLLRYENLFFRFKIAALVLAVVNTWVFHRTIYRSIAEWDRDAVPPPRVRMAGAVSLVLWALIITAGRMIPYQAYWFD